MKRALTMLLSFGLAVNLQAQRAQRDAQDAMEEALGRAAAAKAEMEREISQAALAEDRKLLAKLRDFERQAAERDEFAQAAAIAAKVDALEDRLRRTDPELRQPLSRSAMNLPMSEARLTGSVSHNIAGGLGRWKTVGSEAMWDLRGLKPGRYEVEARYSCGRDETGKTDADGETILLSAGGEFELFTAPRSPAALRHQVMPTETWLTERVVSLGEIDLPGTSLQLRIRSVRAATPGLMQLTGLRLIPLPERPGAAPGLAPDELTKRVHEAVAAKLIKLRDARAADLRRIAGDTANGPTKEAATKALAELLAEPVGVP